MVKDLDNKNLLKNLLKAVKKLTEVLKKTNLTKNLENYDNLEKVGNKRIQIKHDNAIKSPMVGTVYLSPDPKTKSFIKQGQTVKKGDTLLIIEAMKTFNEIKAPKSGVIEKIVVLNSQPVEFGDVLLIFE